MLISNSDVFTVPVINRNSDLRINDLYRYIPESKINGRYNAYDVLFKCHDVLVINNKNPKPDLMYLIDGVLVYLIQTYQMYMAMYYCVRDINFIDRYNSKGVLNSIRYYPQLFPVLDSVKLVRNKIVHDYLMDEDTKARSIKYVLSQLCERPVRSNKTAIEMFECMLNSVEHTILNKCEYEGFDLRLLESELRFGPKN